MRYTFTNISTEKFSINGRTLFKTFIPKFVDNEHILVFNIYDSKCPLIPPTNVAEIEVDNVVYNNATELINAIHDVLFSRKVSGAIDNVQIEINRLAIIDIQTNKADANHTHDNYYTKQQINDKLNNIPAGQSIDSAEVDGDNLKFFSGGEEIFRTVVKTFLQQGNSLSFENSNLQLKNTYGEILSEIEIKARESYYDVFQFQNNQEDDLTDFIQNQRFTLAKTIGGLYFFISIDDNEEDFKNTRIFINSIDSFFDLGELDIEKNGFKAWRLDIENEVFITGNEYEFNFWYQFLDDNKNIFSDENGNPQYESKEDKRIGYYDTINKVYYPNIEVFQTHLPDNGGIIQDDAYYKLTPKDASCTTNSQGSSSNTYFTYYALKFPKAPKKSFSFELDIQGNFDGGSSTNFQDFCTAKVTIGSLTIAGNETIWDNANINIINNPSGIKWEFVLADDTEGNPIIAFKQKDVPYNFHMNVRLENLVLNNVLNVGNDPLNFYTGWKGFVFTYPSQTADYRIRKSFVLGGDSQEAASQEAAYPIYNKSYKTLTGESGYFCIRLPQSYTKTNFYIKFHVYSHYNGLDTYELAGYPNNPNGWVQTFARKAKMNPNGTLETITLTNAPNATDFRIYLGESNTPRFADKIFIETALATGLAFQNVEISSLDDFVITIESTIEGDVKRTF